MRASRILARLQDERGIALVMSIGIMFVLTITVSSVMVYTAASAGHANHSNAGQKAYALAEAGVNDALAVLNANYPDTTHPYPGNWCLLRAQTPPAGFPGRFAPPGLRPLTLHSTPDARPNETATGGGDPPSFLIWSHVGDPLDRQRAEPDRARRCTRHKDTQVKVPVIIPRPGRAARRAQLALLHHRRDRAQLVDIRSPFYVGQPPSERCRPSTASLCHVYDATGFVPTVAAPCPSTAGN